MFRAPWVRTFGAAERGWGPERLTFFRRPGCGTDHLDPFQIAIENWPAAGSRARFVEGAIADTRAAWDALSDAEQAWWSERAAASFGARRSA